MTKKFQQAMGISPKLKTGTVTAQNNINSDTFTNNTGSNDQQLNYLSFEFAYAVIDKKNNDGKANASR